MKLSKIFKLNTFDFIKGVVLAIISAVLNYLYNSLTSNGAINTRELYIVTLTTLLSFIINRFFSNSEGKLFIKDKNLNTNQDGGVIPGKGF